MARMRRDRDPRPALARAPHAANVEARANFLRPRLGELFAQPAANRLAVSQIGHALGALVCDGDRRRVDPQIKMPPAQLRCCEQPRTLVITAANAGAKVPARRSARVQPPRAARRAALDQLVKHSVVVLFARSVKPDGPRAFCFDHRERRSVIARERDALVGTQRGVKLGAHRVAQRFVQRFITDPASDDAFNHGGVRLLHRASVLRARPSRVRDSSLS